MVFGHKKSFINKELPSISALTKGNNSWRIDWFGDLAFPNRLFRRTQPSLLVHLSKVLDSSFHYDPSVQLSPDSTTPARFQRKVWVSAGTLPLLRIGDIWRDGKLEASPDYQLERFVDLQIDDSTVHLVKAGLNLDDKGFLLPLSEHPWHLNCTHSYCVMVDLPDGRQLIIPCVELIRFYFGSSSGLITKLFLPPLQRKTLYGSPQFDPTTKRLVLELAEKISGASAADIGRLHLDPIAWRAAMHIGTSALKASVARQTIYPQGFFPFEGTTTLAAAGKWLSLGDRAEATFLVYSLRSCSHPFPFRSLRYKVQNVFSRANSKSPRQSLIQGSVSDAPQQVIVERDASNSLAPKTIQVRLEPRFPDLQKKPVWKDKVLATTDGVGRTGGRVGQAVESAAVGEPGSEQRIRPVNLDVLLNTDPAKRDSIPQFLCDAVEALSVLDGLDIDLLTDSDEDGWTVPITALSDEDGEIDLRLSVSSDGGVPRLRRASAFGVRRGQVHVSVVFIESSPLYIKVYATNGKNLDEVWETLHKAGVHYLHLPNEENLNIGNCTSLLREVLG
ncbi:hypothetical protein [Collimonas pratensis]|uniref:TnsE C-terminal domain-containing protein n=1 Tax=Collimonas pratensis TaxID=279113 RepID=A0A127QBX0_9BURK|nr:hypothetical protein [Collimonas pratensis]AMP07514.1 hypothetical protein CPter91_5226 [Collimonas pratensis]